MLLQQLAIMFAVAGGKPGLLMGHEGWKHGHQNNSNWPPQKQLAAISSRAPSWAFDVEHVRASPVTGCRSGSIYRHRYRLQISLCLMEGKPPFGHERVCSTENVALHPHIDGVCKGCQLYLRASASWNAPLWSVKPNTSIGSEVSHQFIYPQHYVTH